MVEKVESLNELENLWRVKEAQSKIDESKNKKKTGSFCLVCGGEVIERSYIPFIGNKGIYGPGGRSQATENDRQIVGYHCGICGNEYYFPPPRDLLKAKSQM